MVVEPAAPAVARLLPDVAAIARLVVESVLTMQHHAAMVVVIRAAVMVLAMVATVWAWAMTTATAHPVRSLHNRMAMQAGALAMMELAFSHRAVHLRTTLPAMPSPVTAMPCRNQRSSPVVVVRILTNASPAAMHRPVFHLRASLAGAATAVAAVVAVATTAAALQVALQCQAVFPTAKSL